MTHQQVQFEKPAQASSRAEVEQQKTVLFHIEVVNTKTGRRERQTAYPMTEKECSVMVSKMTAYPWRTVELVPAEAPTFEGEQREAAFKTVWRDTHRDYRGRLADGSLSLMSWAKFGGGLVAAASITDAELAERLEDAKRRAR